MGEGKKGRFIKHGQLWRIFQSTFHITYVRKLNMYMYF